MILYLSYHMYVYNIHTYQTRLNLNIKRVVFHVFSLTKCIFLKGHAVVHFWQSYKLTRCCIHGLLYCRNCDFSPFPLNMWATAHMQCVTFETWRWFNGRKHNSKHKNKHFTLRQYFCFFKDITRTHVSHCDVDHSRISVNYRGVHKH